jgi:hypothetical protein
MAAARRGIGPAICCFPFVAIRVTRQGCEKSRASPRIADSDALGCAGIDLLATAPSTRTR